jgi:hypothetical protein
MVFGFVISPLGLAHAPGRLCPPTNAVLTGNRSACGPF